MAILRYFEYDHLPEPLKTISFQCAKLAYHMSDTIESDPELTMGLRKLLEAKDCFVRAAVAQVNRSKNNPNEGSPLPRPNEIV